MERESLRLVILQLEFHSDDRRAQICEAAAWAGLNAIDCAVAKSAEQGAISFRVIREGIVQQLSPE
jgi:hypothetical protein